MASSYICFENVPQLNDQVSLKTKIEVNHLKNYFKTFGIDTKELISKDSTENLSCLLGIIDKWLENANDQGINDEIKKDFIMVGNAILYHVSTMFNQSDSDYNTDLVQKFMNKILADKYLKYKITSRLYLFQSWWYANKHCKYAPIFFSFYLILLEKSDYNPDFMPDLNDTITAADFCLVLAVDIQFSLLNSLLKLFKNYFVTSEITSSQLITATYNTIRVFIDIFDEKSDLIALVSLVDVLFTTQFLLSPSFSSLLDSKERRMRMVFCLAHKIKNNEEIVDILSDHKELLNQIGLRLTETRLQDAKIFVQIVHIANKFNNIDYASFIEQLNLTSEDELEEILFHGTIIFLIKLMNIILLN
ncbi:hypothetical protein HZS_1135, partial [Henneguya salminicola]